MNSQQVLLVDDEQQILLSYSLILRSSGIANVLTVQDSRQVMPLLGRQDVAVIILDLIMPHISGIELLSKIKQEFPQISVIVMTAVNDLDKAVECMKEGAGDYLVKPVEKSRFVSCVKKTLELITLRDEVSALTQKILHGHLEHEDFFAPVVTVNKNMKAIFYYVEAIAKSDKPICITGETGVGKELISRIIHNVSGLSGEFIPVNVAGLDDPVFSDTLFGHKRGAYTGADKDRKGLIVQASGGTLLLDEIGDLSSTAQVKLLRLLEEKTYYPLGSDTPGTSYARILVSTNKDLKKLISEGNFRKDLYFRLCTHHVHIPPLRERREDIPLLIEQFIAEAAGSVNKKKPVYPRELITLLVNYDFPGNVRELQAMIFDAVAQHKSGILSLESFKEFIKNKGINSKIDPAVSLPDAVSGLNITGQFPTMKEAEEFLIEEALKRANGNQGIAASLLGITRQALNKRLARNAV
ncbi:MAG: sigma-54-dependent Fis family transcriptional regulator [Nitrospirae bacterium]|nr:sigma-54-dependent Fis family transcriptional regulator [Nitrospirota bacterium]